jgi:hypothetical protein
MAEAEAWRGLAGVHALADRIEEWARGRQDIRALAFFGSLRRHDQPGDEWSVDALVVVDERAAWTSEREARWAHEIVPVWIDHNHPSPIPGINVRQAIFEGGYDSDLVVVDRERLKVLSDDPAVARVVLGHGYVIAFDRDDAFAAVPATADSSDVGRIVGIGETEARRQRPRDHARQIVVGEQGAGEGMRVSVCKGEARLAEPGSTA